jgi:hypothetical protein
MILRSTTTRTKKRRAEEKIRRAEEEIEEKRRMERVKQIDSLIVEGQGRLQELICEKDVLQRRPNPLFNYTTEEVKTEDPGSDNQENDDSGTTSSLSIQASRKFKFPPDDLVEEYLDMIFSSRRLTKMNHTYLWKDSESIDDDEDDTIGDDLLTPSADAHKLYQDTDVLRRNGKNGNQKNGNGKNGKGRNGGGGSWLLRQTIGKGPSLGEKIGEAAETAAYQAVCSAVMSFLARTLSSLHGINVMQHSDIRLVLEQAPGLPPVGKSSESLLRSRHIILAFSQSRIVPLSFATIIRSFAFWNRDTGLWKTSWRDNERDAIDDMIKGGLMCSICRI